MITAYITNTGKYAEGKASGDWLRFPTTTEEVQALLSRIGVDGVSYEEYFIAEYQVEISGLRVLGQYENIDELNYLASLLAEMNDFPLDKYEAAILRSDSSGNAKDLINLVHNLDSYDYFPGVCNHEELGRYLIDELSMETIPEWIGDYFDYEAYGRDFEFNTGGIFTPTGFVYRDYKQDFIEHYNGRDDIPGEYRVFEYPIPPEREVSMSSTISTSLMKDRDVLELIYKEKLKD